MHLRLYLMLALLLPLFAGSSTTTTTSQQDPARAVLTGKRLLALGNFFLGDFGHKPTEHHEAVEGQLCEFAARSNVTIDFMLWNTQAPNQAKDVFALCHGRTVFCTAADGLDKDVLRCYEHHFGPVAKGVSAVHDAITSRDDEHIEDTQVLAEALGLPPPFRPGHLSRLQHSSWARSFMQRFDGKGTYPVARDCQVPPPEVIPASAFPLYVKYAQGLHSSGGWGGQCVRQLSYIENRAELEKRLPFFCGDGMRSYWFLRTPEQRDIFLTRHLFGIEISTEVAVHRGVVRFAAFRAAHMTCAGRLVHTWPASAPGWEAEAEDKCRALVSRVVDAAGVWNALVGVQLMYDWRPDSPTRGCHLIELNPRPHDWAMLGNHAWNLRHGGKDYFDYGAAALYLAFDLDPAPLRLTAPPQYTSAVALSCPSRGTHEVFGTGGIFTYAQFMRAAMDEPDCDVQIAPTALEAREALDKKGGGEEGGGWPCLGGPEMLPLGPELEALCNLELRDKGIAFWWIDFDKVKKDVAAVCRGGKRRKKKQKRKKKKSRRAAEL